MQSITVRTHIGHDGALKLDLPQFSDVEVEVTIREASIADVPANAPKIDQMAVFDIPRIKVDPTHTALNFLSREELYDDDGR